MQRTTQNKVLLISLVVLLGFTFLLNISLGSVSIPFSQVFNSLTGGEVSKTTWEYIIINYRLPKAVMAIIAGMGLSLSGLLMQTLFRNPMAGPFVLGLSSGASLGVAFIILSSGLLPGFLAGVFLSSYGIILASTLGSLLVLLSVLLVAQRLRNTMAILIVGLMFGSFTGAVVNVLTYFSTAQQLQKFTFWAMGNLGGQEWSNIIILAVACTIGIILAAVCIKPLNALLLGERYAKSMGIDFKKVRFIIIISVSLMAGGITAFAGPIAFIGLAVPHMAKLIFKTSDHLVLFWATLLSGAVIVLICDIITQLPGNDLTLPINAVTSIVGAPVVIWLLLRKRKMNYN
ncbi:iron ABC transporter permease [Flavobacterium suaedae]|uniref:iron ABC transporter permease n=1 Tax=Flavobacterium suaedae TaxID=1767027 RepID=UPI00166E3595|nr:iron ABC transporter permease [Flavobacterium suaedae]